MQAEGERGDILLHRIERMKLQQSFQSVRKAGFEKRGSAG